jgi:small subunit ribosomal protein S6
LREYETVFVLHPTYEEKEFEAEVQAVSDLITASGGSILEIDRWGRRRLAYDIKKVHEGIYTLIRYKSEVAVLKDLERRFRMNERMLRYMTVISEGPLPQPHAEGGPEGPGNGERRPRSAPGDAPAAPAESGAPLPILPPIAPPGPVEAPDRAGAPETIEPRIGEASASSDTSAYPADGTSL